MGDIKIRGRIEIIMQSNKFMIPGNEPVSTVTSTTLDENRRITSTVVDVSDALTAIPGSTIEMTFNPKRKWFVFPSGPANDPNQCDEGNCKSIPDYYKILQSIGEKVIIQENKPDGICSEFPYKGIF